MATQSYKNPLKNTHTSELIISFDIESNEPVSNTLKNGQVWSAELASASSLFWNANSNILDIGCHIGTYSLLAASYTKGKVISIEPDPKNFSYIVKNKENNDFKHWETWNLAASDSNGEVKFCSGGPGSHIFAEGWSENTISVDSRRIDDIVGEIKIDFIKIDVEGWEIAALDGLQKTIERDSPPIVFEVNGFTLQWFDKTPNDLLKKLESFGYRLFVLSQRFIPINSYEPFPFGVVDCFALKDEHIPAISQYLTLPLSETQRKEIVNQYNEYANEDMKKYFSWYREKVQF